MRAVSTAGSSTVDENPRKVRLAMDKDGNDQAGFNMPSYIKTMEDDPVDLFGSMDHDGVDLYKSMEDDFAKATGARKLSYDELVNATDNFLEQNKLGEGGFGSVYKGFLTEMNSYVAVKRVSRDSKQSVKEYAYEVKIINQLRHRNIVKLMGWCHERNELLLVYEFMSNGSLDSHLFKDNQLLVWEMRYKIALGCASGLLYLHEEREQYVVHRDIKTGNIMLDSDFNPKLGDFGLARQVEHGKGLEDTTLAGTIGYLSPEYATKGRASKESDVYSFGIVVLEIVCGRKIINRKAREDQINLRDWVWNLYKEGKLLEAADPRLNGVFNEKEAECLLIVGLWCARYDATLRPTIEEAIHVLKFLAPCPVLLSKRPPFSMSSSGVRLSGESQNESPRLISEPPMHRTINFSEEEQKRGKGNKAKNSALGFLNKNKEKKEAIDILKSTGLRMFSYKELVRATNNFSKENILEVKGHWTVYKGFLKGLSMYSVKRTSKGSKQLRKEYVNRAMIKSRLRHPNLVQFIGWCQEEKQLCLVFELMQNKSLDYNLFTRRDNLLTWTLRYKIAKGLASALLFLHEEADECVVHGDVNLSSVVLDTSLSAKLWGFGNEKYLLESTSMETFGHPDYIAPECFHVGMFSKESDVYSFGIVALVIACGRRPRYPIKDEDTIVDWVWNLYGEGKLVEAADPKLKGEFDEKEMECLMVVGLWCTLPNPNARPSVRQAIRVLDLQAPLPRLPFVRPVFMWPPLPLSWSGSSSSIGDTSGSMAGIVAWNDG